MSSMDASDVEFDLYWDEEARNPNRNRIRIGRQYQAQCPPLLKAGESDGRKLEELETLMWNPHNSLSSNQLNHYFAIAKSIGLFIQAIDTCQDGIEETECLEEEKCSLRPFEILNSGTKCVLEAKSDRQQQLNNNTNNNNNNNSNNTNVNTTSPEKQSVTTRQRLQQQQKKEPNVQMKDEINATSTSSSSSLPSTSSSPLKQSSNTRIQAIAKGLPSFILSHHSSETELKNEKACKFSSNTVEQAINIGSTERYNIKTLSKLLMGHWNESEAKIFSQAIKECGKNFSAIKKDYLPWKSVRSIIEFYYLTLDKERERKRKLRKTEKKTTKQQSPLNENKRRKNGPDNNNDGDVDSKNDDDNGNGNNTNENNNNNNNSNNNNNDNENNNNTDNAKDNETSNDDSNNDNKKQSGQNEKMEPSNETDVYRDELLLSLAKGMTNGGNISLDTTSMMMTGKINSGNINGNNSLLSPETRPGQEVKPIKAKPILSHNDTMDNNNTITDGSNKTNLGSLNLYLHGELVLRLNAQQQESGQKWVESMDLPLRRKNINSINNGFGSNRSTGIKKLSDFKTLNKEDLDDVSLGGGDVSGSDDDSMTSNESSSLVASSPSSSSTITTPAAKKARVKLENLNSMNGNTLISSPNLNGRKCESQSTNTTTSSSSLSSSVNGTLKSITTNSAASQWLNTFSELDIKKKLIDLAFNSEEIQLLFSTFFNPPKAHSNSLMMPASTPNLTNNSNNISNSNSPNLFPYSMGKESNRTKSISPTIPNSLPNANNNSKSYTNGFVSGPVDLTRKTSLDNHNQLATNDKNHTSRHKLSSAANNSAAASSSFSLPRLAHESSSSSTLPPLSHHRLSSLNMGNNSLFSLPAPPPPPSNVPISFNKSSSLSTTSLNQNHRKSSSSSSLSSLTSIRNLNNDPSSIHQYAK